MSYPIKIVCCMCDKDLGTKSGGKTPGEITHSYCIPCADSTTKDVVKEPQRPKRKLSNKVDPLILQSA
jgi:hypothetical protein